jgi:hypothetical protein
MEKGRRWVESMVGIAVLGSLLTGVLSLIVGVIALLGDEFVTGGVLFVAAGLSFGLLANAVLRQ